MAKRSKLVEYGHSDGDMVEKGTLFVLDSFEGFSEQELSRIIEVAETRKFTKIVLFPHNEKTLRTMGETGVSAFHTRLKNLVALANDTRSTLPLVVDRWEEKRKKYTPIELIVRYFEESYRAPYFLYLTDRYANLISTFASFEECIKKIRLIIDQKEGLLPTSKLKQYQNRWDYV
ncbi:hypothetical protein CIG75_10390 [Tumebacillus algifaecis]|uniref:Uncharacterized protein n=1 Tax=Tumebacillus algifaecis TaxID=1214604 RepID=A0A223D134_9BACL|nr:hypothetical protein [Tumebacillus algifaecis]ASS75358.1 hypothetical protein CIG75_10390 [Tumebacillus algifaecis]